MNEDKGTTPGPHSRRPWDAARHWMLHIQTLALGAVVPLVTVVIVADSMSRVQVLHYGRDMSIFATVARCWQDGLMPYRDVYDIKPPLIYVALRIGYAFWGYDIESFRRVIMILVAFGTLVMYGGLSYAGALVAAPVASFGFLTLMVVNSWDLDIAHAETLAVSFAAVACGCAAAHQGSGRWWWAAASGVAVGFMMLAKHPAGFFAVPVVAQLVLWGGTGTWCTRLRYAVLQAFAAGVGVCAVLGIMVLYFTWNGAAEALYQTLWVDLRRYSGIDAILFPSGPVWPIIWAHTPLKLRGFFGSAEIWPFPSAIILLVPVTLLRLSRWAIVAWLWLAAAYLAVIVQPRGENHYLVIGLAAMALAVGILFQLLVSDTLIDRPSQARNRLLAGLAIAWLLFGPTWTARYLPSRNVDLSDAPPPASKRVGLRIGEAAQPGDTLYVEDEPLDVYVYAGVRPFSRFICGNSGNPNDFAERLESLKSKPTFVVITNRTYERMQAGQLQEGVDAEALLVKEILNDSYEEWFADHPAGVVYRRKDRPALGAPAP